MKLITVGADVEVFLANETEVVSAEGIIKGTKHMPVCFDKTYPHRTTSLDNVLAEFTITPSITAKQFCKELRAGLSHIENTAQEYGLGVLIAPSARLDNKYLETDQAKTFGCDPDFNAYKVNKYNFPKQNPRPKIKDKNLRSCGGHLHLGVELDEDELNSENGANLLLINLVKSMDINVGVPSLIMEQDNDRRKLYGNAGAFRFKPYGIEYRTVSNFYLKSEELMSWAFTASHRAVNLLNNGLDNSLAEAAKGIINSGNVEQAKEFVKDNNILCVESLVA